MKDSPNITRNLETYLSEIIKNAPSIVAVYLFGSYAREEEKAQSDIDLAFLLDEQAYRADPFEATCLAYMIAMRIGMGLHMQTDVTILNSSSIEMAYEVITTGRCVYESDMDRRLEYEVTMRGMYYDFRPFLTQLRSRFLARL